MNISCCQRPWTSSDRSARARFRPHPAVRFSPICSSCPSRLAGCFVRPVICHSSKTRPRTPRGDGARTEAAATSSARSGCACAKNYDGRPGKELVVEPPAGSLYQWIRFEYRPISPVRARTFPADFRIATKGRFADQIAPPLRPHV